MVLAMGDNLLASRPVVALVPARSGSKGVPRKNMVNVLGVPLLTYTIKAALEASCIHDVWLSSEDDEILGVGQRLGAKVVIRPSKLATDEASATQVVQHFLSTLPQDFLFLDPLIVYLQPTSPLRTAKHIDEAYTRLCSSGARSLISVNDSAISPYKTFKLDGNGLLQSLFEEKISNFRRQDLPRTCAPNGAIYMFLSSDFVDRGGFPSNGSLPFFMSRTDGLDIDSPDDLKLAVELMRDAYG